MSDRDDPFTYFKKAAGIKDQPKPESDSEPAPERELEPDDYDPYRLPLLRPEDYMAFRIGKRRERLLIARASKPMRFPLYHQLLDMNFDQDFQHEFNLFFHGMTVKVTGVNLWPVVHAIAHAHCAAIYEYDARLYPAMPEKGEPLIATIELAIPEALVNADS